MHNSTNKMKILKWLFTVTLVSLIPMKVLSQDLWITKLKGKDWLKPFSKLELMRSTKADVKMEFGKPEDLGFAGADFIEYYDVFSGRVTATFTTTDCRRSSGNVIPKGVLEKISLEPSGKIFLSSLKVPLAKFKLSRDNDAPVIVTFSDLDDGVRIEVQHGRITFITFLVPQREDNRCQSR